MDYVSVTVYYTFASGFTVAQDASVFANQSTELRWDGMYRAAVGVYGPANTPVGDLPRLPPSGLEGRPVQLFVKPSRGDLNVLPDSGLDGMTVKVVYRPVYGHRP